MLGGFRAAPRGRPVSQRPPCWLSLLLAGPLPLRRPVPFTPTSRWYTVLPILPPVAPSGPASPRQTLTSPPHARAPRDRSRVLELIQRGSPRSSVGLSSLWSPDSPNYPVRGHESPPSSHLGVLGTRPTLPKDTSASQWRVQERGQGSVSKRLVNAGEPELEDRWDLEAQEEGRGGPR